MQQTAAHIRSVAFVDPWQIPGLLRRSPVKANTQVFSRRFRRVKEGSALTGRIQIHDIADHR